MQVKQILGTRLRRMRKKILKVINAMSKYDDLWNYVVHENKNALLLSFEGIKTINGCEIEHSFLNHKNNFFTMDF